MQFFFFFFFWLASVCIINFFLHFLFLQILLNNFKYNSYVSCIFYICQISKFKGRSAYYFFQFFLFSCYCRIDIGHISPVFFYAPSTLRFATRLCKSYWTLTRASNVSEQQWTQHDMQSRCSKPSQRVILLLNYRSIIPANLTKHCLTK